MKRINIIKACTDLGVDVDGAGLGPNMLTINYENVNKVYIERVKNVNKEKEKGNKKKNLKVLNKFNKKLYKTITKSLKNNKVPIIIGGDHSIAMASALATIKKYKKMGIIWIDAHGDFNTFNTTTTGNIHGLPLAAITGYEKEALTKFHKGNLYKYENTVIVGARDIEKSEMENLKEAGIIVFSTSEIRKYGVKNIMKKAIEIASNNTKGIHISYDIDIIEPNIAKGVSVPSKNGISLEEADMIVEEILENKKTIKSIDIVEYNPLKDEGEKTRVIVEKIVEKFINNL